MRPLLIIHLATSLDDNGATHDRLAERVRRRTEQLKYWSTAQWDNTLAINRHIELLQSFEQGDRDRNVPLEEFEIPWPILQRPLSYSIASIEKGRS